MSALPLRCPVTNDIIGSTKLEANARMLAGLWDHVMVAYCGNCAMAHEITVRHAFIDEALSDEVRSGRGGPSS